jgi:hypothetical protein
MKSAFLTIALTTAMLMGSMVFTESAEARPRAWRYYGGPARYYGGYYSNSYPRYYGGYYAPRYYGGYYAPRYYSGYYAPRYYSYPYRYSYGGPGVYFRY